MVQKNPTLKRIAGGWHRRVENTTDEWLELELVERCSGFRLVVDLAPGANIDFFPTGSGEIDITYRRYLVDSESSKTTSAPLH